MNSRFLLVLFTFLFAFNGNMFGQNLRPSKIYLTEKYNHLSEVDKALNHQNYFSEMSAEMGISPASEMVMTKRIDGNNGYVHYKFKQYHGGLPIFGNTYILHEKDGIVEVANGLYTPNINLDLQPRIDAQRAIKTAKQEMKATSYVPLNQEPILCIIDPAFPGISEALSLAYQVDIESVTPFGKRRYFIDAHTGKAIKDLPLILEEGVPSTAETKYYGTQNIITDSIGPELFILHDPTRGDGISVFDEDGASFESTSSHWNLTNNNKDEVALDAHYCTQQYYDLMLERFGWEGLDGVGGELIAHVHNNGASNVNAFWDGVSSNYGDGDCNYGPLTTLEVVGHEFTHGMVDYTSQLVYIGESGAINESMADIIGKTLEHDSDFANFNWDLGHSFLLTADAEPFRVMDDPKSVEMPAYYKGEYWMDGGGVHTNSSIGNLWFTMLVDGKQGTNEAGIDFNVASIGMEKASEIAFLTNKNYLTASSNYNNFYLSSLAVAEQEYGVGSVEAEAVEEAWKAVGLPYVGATSFDLSVYRYFFFENICVSGATYPLSIDIANLGTTAYDPALNAGILILTEFGFPDYEVTLQDVIQPGEILTIEIDDWFTPSADQYYDIDVILILDVPDEDNTNDIGNYSYSTFEVGVVDMGLFAEFRNTQCFATEYPVYFSLYNGGCEMIPAGSTIGLSIENMAGQEIWSEDYVLSSDLPGFSPDDVFYNVDAALFSSSEDIMFKLDFSVDSNAGNNSYYAVTPSSVAIEDEYLNGFSNNVSQYPELELDYLGEPIYEYQGESYFAATGLFEGGSSVSTCPDPADLFFNTGFFGGVNTTINACLDLSTFDNLNLSFDLIQFRNESAAIDNNMHSSMLQVAWYGSEDGSEIIFGQNEGEIYHYDFPLPDYFEGELEIKFYTEQGDFTVNPLSIENHDVVMLDNLQIQTLISNTEDLQRNDLVSISPNPTLGNLTINSVEMMREVELRSVDGRLLKRTAVNSNNITLDLSDYENGFYLLHTRMVNGEWAVKKIIKME